MPPARTRSLRRRPFGPLRGAALLFVPALLLAILLVASLVRERSSDPLPADPGSSDGRSPRSGSGWTDGGGGHDGASERPGRPAAASFPLVNEFSLGPGVKPYDNEDARRVGFPVVDRGGGRRNATASTAVSIFLATPYFGEWNPRHFYFLHLGNATFARYACPVDNCRVTRDPSRVAEADAVLFHVRDTEVFSVPAFRSPEQVWILYSMEPPWLEVRDMRRFDGLFNWTMGYRRDSDVTVSYGFVGKRRRNGKAPRPAPLPAVLGGKADRAVWLVSNCNTDGNREGYVRRLRRVYPVDVVGGCGREGCRPAETRKCYLELARRYKFYLAFENALCPDYATEKLFNALDYPVVPVVLGGADYSRLTPPGSVIDASSFPTPEALGRHLWEVSRNESLYLSHFRWKAAGHASYLQPWMCDLCERLHRDRGVAAPAKTGPDLERWWGQGGRCRRWTEDGFREVERHPFPRYRSRLFADDDNSSTSRPA